MAELLRSEIINEDILGLYSPKNYLSGRVSSIIHGDFGLQASAHLHWISHMWAQAPIGIAPTIRPPFFFNFFSFSF